MGSELTIPWVGTSGTAHDGDYAAVVVLAAEGGASPEAGVTYADGHFEFPDGTRISAELLTRLDV
jgi:hypothetical protein